MFATHSPVYEHVRHSHREKVWAFHFSPKLHLRPSLASSSARGKPFYAADYNDSKWKRISVHDRFILTEIMKSQLYMVLKSAVSLTTVEAIAVTVATITTHTIACPLSACAHTHS